MRGHPDAYRNIHANPHCDPHGDPHGDPHCDPHGYCHADRDTNSNPSPDRGPYQKASGL